MVSRISLTKFEAKWYNTAMKLNVKKIEIERKRLGLSRSEFAKLIGIGYSGYYAIITRATTTIKTLGKLSKLLKVDWKDLLK
jgi:transcriptional regulator with XRE-family HTH domain